MDTSQLNTHLIEVYNSWKTTFYDYDFLYYEFESLMDGEVNFLLSYLRNEPEDSQVFFLSNLVKFNSHCEDRLVELTGSNNDSIKVGSCHALLYTKHKKYSLNLLKQIVHRYISYDNTSNISAKQILELIFQGISEFYDELYEEGDDQKGEFVLPEFKEMLLNLIRHFLQTRDIPPALYSAIYYIHYYFPVNKIISILHCDELYAIHATGAFKSLDGGDSWEMIYHGLVRDIFIDSQNMSILFICPLTGVKRSMDGGKNWKELSVCGDQAAFYTLFKISEEPLSIYAWNVDLFKTITGGSVWEQVNAPYGFAAAGATPPVCSPINPDLFYMGVGNRIYMSPDKGNTWACLSGELTEERVQSLAISPGNPSMLYAGTLKGLFKSTDGGKTWTISNNGLPHTIIESIEVNPTQPDTIYIATWNGLFISLDEGEHWQPIDARLSGSRIDTFSLDINNPDTLYAGMNGRLYKSSDSGQSWVEISNTPFSWNESEEFGTRVKNKDTVK